RSALRPQCRRAPGGGDLVPRRAPEPRADGGVGPDHRRRPGDRRAALAGRARHHPAHPRARDVASLSQGGYELTLVAPAANETVAVSYLPGPMRACAAV